MKTKSSHPLTRDRFPSNHENVVKRSEVVRRISSYQRFVDEDVVCELSDIQKIKLEPFIVAEDNPEKLYETLKHCVFFKCNPVLTDLMLDMIKYKRMLAFKFMFPRVKQIDDTLFNLLFRRAIEYKNLQACDFLISDEYDFRKCFAGFWDEDSDWNIFAAMALARSHPKKISDMVPDPYLVKKADSIGMVTKMVKFIVHCKSLSRTLTKNRDYQFRLLMAIMKNKFLDGSKKAEFISRLTLNKLEGNGDALLMHAIQNCEFRVFKALLDNKKLKGSVVVVIEASQSWSTKFIGALLRDERFRDFFDHALLAAAKQQDAVVLQYLLKHKLAKAEFKKNSTLLKQLIFTCLAYDSVNLAEIFNLVPAEEVKEAITLEMAEYCAKENAWDELGILMSVQFSKPPVIVPQLLVGLQMVLIANARKQYSGDLAALSSNFRIATVYKLGATSKKVDAYLEGFRCAYKVLPDELRCSDWLMDMHQERELSKMDLLAISKGITPVVTAASTPSDLLKIAKKALTIENE